VVHPCWLLTSFWPYSPIEVRAHLGDKERKFLCHVDPRELFFHHICFPIPVRKDHVKDCPCATQPGRQDLHSGKREVAPVLFVRDGVDSRVPDGQVVQSAVLIGGTGIVGELEDLIEQISSCRPELISLIGGNRFWPRDRINEGVTIERIQLIEGDYRDHKPVAHIRRCNVAADPDDRVEIIPARLVAVSLDQQLVVTGIARNENICLNALDGKDPAQAAGTVPVAALLKRITRSLAIGQSRSVSAADALRELLLNSQARESRFDLAEGLHKDRSLRSLGWRRGGGYVCR
jgi:hypothetical protein